MNVDFLLYKVDYSSESIDENPIVTESGALSRQNLLDPAYRDLNLWPEFPSHSALKKQTFNIPLSLFKNIAEKV